SISHSDIDDRRQRVKLSRAFDFGDSFVVPTHEPQIQGVHRSCASKVRIQLDGALELPLSGLTISCLASCCRSPAFRCGRSVSAISREISACTMSKSDVLRLYSSPHTCVASRASINSALMSRFSPRCKTRPVMMASTPSERATFWGSTSLPLYLNEELRAMTFTPGSCDRRLRSDSLTPSDKYSTSG